MTYVFGPVPSRRLGNSLGVNNIPIKHCSYSCVYCQVGRTTNLTVGRRTFYEPRRIIEEVVSAVEEYLGKIDYITFVPNGEPALDINLGKAIKGIKEKVEEKVAVITNGSLIGSAYQDLLLADLVSVKIDAGSEDTYRRINRPHPDISLRGVIDSVMDFREKYNGTLLTETMLIDGLNDGERDLKKTAKVVGRIAPEKAYLAIPVRPPLEPWVRPSSRVAEARAIFRENGINADLLDFQERAEFGTAGAEDPSTSILNIIAVHPLREDYVRKILDDRQVSTDQVIERLIRSGKVRRIQYSGKSYLVLASSRTS